MAVKLPLPEQHRQYYSSKLGNAWGIKSKNQTFKVVREINHENKFSFSWTSDVK
jgi:hypothetical protein